MAKLKVGETFYAPKTIIAYQMNDITNTSVFTEGQKIGVVRSIEDKYVTFLDSVDDGWGGTNNVEYFIYLLDLDVEEKTTIKKTEVPKNNSTKPTKSTAEDILDIFVKNTNTGPNRKTPPVVPINQKIEEPEKTILGLTYPVFFGITIFLSLLVFVIAVISWSSKKEEPQYVVMNRPLSGVDEDDTVIVPKSKIVME